MVIGIRTGPQSLDTGGVEAGLDGALSHSGKVEMARTDERLTGRMTESTDVNHAECRLIGSEKAGKKMIELE